MVKIRGDRDHFYDVFDYVFNSYTRGKEKQEPSLFNDVATELDLPLSEILFIDDNAGNVNQVKKVGMQALHYVYKESFIQEIK